MDDSNETLKAVLRDMGIDDVDTMDSSDIVLLARAMGIDVPGEDADAQAGPDDMDESEPADEDYGMDDANADEQADLDTAFMVDQTLADAELNGEALADTEMNDQTETAPNAPSAAEDHSHDAIISAFCDITGSDPTSAGHFLEAFGWDLAGAIPMYLENAQQTTANATTPPSLSGIRGQRAPVHTHFNDETGSPMQTSAHGTSLGPMPGIGGDDNDVVMPPLPAGLGTGSMHERHLNSVLASMMRSSMNMQTDDDDDMNPFAGMNGAGLGGGIASFMAAYQGQMDGTGGRQPDRYDEDGVRLPDPVQRQRLVPTGRMFRGGDDEEEEFSMGRAEDPTVEWMFPPPRHLSSQSSLDKARSQAQGEGRWLLVNIQSHEQFASHMLNRDTWVHETMESVLRTTFLLWQRGHTSGEGQAYMRMHRLTDDDLPHIGIIDPRTGAKLLTLTGFISPDDLLIRLMEFADRNLLTAPRIATSSRGSVAGSTNVSSAVSNASSGNNSSTNIEGLASTTAIAADAKSAATSTADSPVGPSDVKHSAKDYKWLPKVPGAESVPVSGPSETKSDARSEGKSGAGDKSTGTSTPAPVPDSSSSAAGQVLGVADAANSEAVKGLDYGDVPDEPAEGAEGAVKVSIKLSNGKAHARRYLKSTPVRALFAVAAAADETARDKQFDLVMRYPPLSLASCVEKTLEECALAGSQLIIKFA